MLKHFLLRTAQNSQPIPDSLLHHPKLAGFVIRRRWITVNPKPGAFDWSFVDSEIRRIQAVGKLAKLTIFAGSSSPAWCTSLPWIPFVRGGNTTPSAPRIPTPWDEKYLSNWCNLLAEAAKRYDGKIEQFACGGPTRDSNELFLPEEVKQAPDYNSAKIPSAWNTVAIQMAASWTKTPYAVHLAEPLKGVKLMDQIIGRFVAASKKGLLRFQFDALHGLSNQSTYAPYQRVLDMKAQGFITGFEAVQASTHPDFKGTFAQAEAKAVSGGQFFDIYAKDYSKL